MIVKDSSDNLSLVSTITLTTTAGSQVVTTAVDTVDYAAIAAAQAAAKAAADKAAADKLAADKAAADKLIADKAVADKAAAEKAIADAKEAAEAMALADAQEAAALQAAAEKIAAEKKAASNTVKVSSSSKSTTIKLDLADKYWGRIAYVQIVNKTKSGSKTTTLDYFAIDQQDGTATITLKKLMKGQTLQVRVGKTILFSKTL